LWPSARSCCGTAGECVRGARVEGAQAAGRRAPSCVRAA
jgi:hypothetical protein